ncbi:MAG: CCA tRNA nucleotidyltransferase [Azospirillaceae bacterium]
MAALMAAEVAEGWDQSLRLGARQAPWLRQWRPLRIIKVLAAAGGETRFVGGCVRNALIGWHDSDIDLATTLPPEAVRGALEAAGLNVVPTGIEHGTVTAVLAHQPFEITTLRRDIETDGRRAVVAFTTDWREDAARRDFTINAMSADLDGRLFDYFGGIEDARTGRIRFVGAAIERIGEDYLRILRYFRFHAWYGQGATDPATLAVIRDTVDGLDRLAVERITHEVLRLLSARQPAEAWAGMASTGAAARVIGHDGDLPVLTRLEAIDSGVRDTHAALRRLAALCPPGDASAAGDRLRLSRKQSAHLAGIDAAIAGAHGVRDTDQARRLAYRYGPAVAADALLIARARGAKAPGRRLVRQWQPPSFPLRGTDALALGVPRGPDLGRVLGAVEDWWVAGDFQADRQSCLVELRRQVGTVGGTTDPA